MKISPPMKPPAGDLPKLETLEATTNAALELLSALLKATRALPMTPGAVHDFQLCLHHAEQCADTLRQKLWAMNLAELTGGAVIECGSRCAQTWHELPLTLYQTMHCYCAFTQAFRGPLLWPKTATGEPLQYIVSACVSKYLEYDHAKLCEASAFFDLDKAQATHARIAAEIRNEHAAAKAALESRQNLTALASAWGAIVPADAGQPQATPEATEAAQVDPEAFASAVAAKLPEAIASAVAAKPQATPEAPAEKSLADRLGVSRWRELRVRCYEDGLRFYGPSKNHKLSWKAIGLPPQGREYIELHARVGGNYGGALPLGNKKREKRGQAVFKANAALRELFPELYAAQEDNPFYNEGGATHSRLKLLDHADGFGGNS